VPCRFSWIDQRLVRDRHITRCKSDALALYLLLCTVADAEGLSYYSDATAAGLLSLPIAKLREARSQLVAAGLIAYQAPFYQILSLDPVQAPTQSPPPPRTNQTLSLSQILRQILEQPKP